jgi:hypothetical protein
MKDRDFKKLQEQLDNSFEEQFRSILNDPIAIDEGVRSIGVCQIKNDSVTLSAFKEAFDDLGNFKKNLPENHTCNLYKRIEDEIDGYKLGNVVLSDKIKLILSGAVFDAQEKVYKKFSNVTDEYTKGTLSEEMQIEMQNVHQLINNTGKRVIEKLGIEEMKELHKSLINIDERIEKAKEARKKAKDNLIIALTQYANTRRGQNDSIFGHKRSDKINATEDLIKFLNDNKTDLKKHIGALTQGRLGTLINDWVKVNRDHAESVLPKELYDKIDSSIKNAEVASRNIRYTRR